MPLLSWQNESIPDAVCSEDSDCPPGEPVVTGNGEAWMARVGGRRDWGWRLLALPLSPPAGVRTGRCLRAENKQRGTCEIFAWCPVETRSRPEYVAVVWDPRVSQSWAAGPSLMVETCPPLSPHSKDTPQRPELHPTMNKPLAKAPGDPGSSRPWPATGLGRGRGRGLRRGGQGFLNRLSRLGFQEASPGQG